MIILAALVLAAVAFAFVTYPLFQEREEEKEAAVNPHLEGLHSKRDAALLAVKELEFDFASGHLSEEDYEALRERYEGRASALDREIERAGGRASTLEDDLEREILQLRRSRPKGSPATEGVVCPQCGLKSREGEKACPRCGSPLPLLCPKCGASYRRGDRFCPRCGVTLSSKRSPR